MRPIIEDVDAIFDRIQELRGNTSKDNISRDVVSKPNPDSPQYKALSVTIRGDTIPVGTTSSCTSCLGKRSVQPGLWCGACTMYDRSKPNHPRVLRPGY